MSGGFPLGAHQAPGFSDTTVTGTDASMALGIEGFTYEDLYDPARLAALHEAFDGWFAAQGSEMYRRFDEYRRTQGEGMTPLQQSDALLAAAPFVGQFIGRRHAGDVAGTRRHEKLPIIAGNTVRNRRGASSMPPTTTMASDRAVTNRLGSMSCRKADGRRENPAALQ